MTSLPEDQQHDPLKQPSASEPGAANESKPSGDWTIPPTRIVPTDETLDPAEPAVILSDDIDPAAVYRQSVEPPNFQQYLPPPPPPERIPNYGHLCLLGLLIGLGLLFTGIVSQIALHAHLFGVSTVEQASTEIHYALGGEALLYLFTLVECLIIFPLIWHKGFFAGVQWNVITAFRLRWRLFSAAGLCFLLAFIDNVVIPGPKNAPIEKIFHSHGAAWFLFGFGVTFAPFFEETFFRGFLLPAMCTVADWTDESLFAGREIKISRRARVALSIAAMILVCCLSLAVPIAIIFSAGKIIASVVGPIAPSQVKYAWAILTTAVIVGLVTWMGLRSLRSNTAEQAVRPLAENGHPRWSISAIVVGSIVTSIPFAAMHAEQTGYSIGPFLLLIAVSLVLCIIRLSTRSLAASTVVHSSYNFMLFAIMFATTSGFRHLDKM